MGTGFDAVALILQGRLTTNSEPLPTSLSTAMVPPIMSTMFFEMAMPRPVPWMPLTVEVRSRVKASKMVFLKASLMPMPLSLTRNSKLATPSSDEGRSMTLKLMEPPVGVNLMALERRLSSTWLRRSLSMTRSSSTMS